MPISVVAESLGQGQGTGSGRDTIITGPVVGIDTKSAVNAGDTGTATSESRWESLQNFRVVNGQPVRMDGSTLYATSFVTPDNASPLLAAPYIDADGNLVWVVITAAGTAYTVAVAGGVATFTQRFTGLSTSPLFWSSIQLGDYLIACNRTDGHWKWDDNNFLPLGARNITDCESDQDGQWTSETAEATVIKEGLQSYKRTVGAAGTAAMTFTPTTNLDLSDGLLLGKAYTEANAKVGFYIRVTDASEVNEASCFYEIATSSGVHELQEAANASWYDVATGATVVFADNTWFRIEIPLDEMTETGTFNLADIDSITISMTSDGLAYDYYVDGFYIIYDTVMPPAAVNSEFKNVYFSGDSTTNGRSAFQYAKAGAPDEYDATAFNQVKEKDGTNLSGLHPFYNQLFITKENSCHSMSVSLSGTVYPSYNFDLQQITLEHGCSSHRSLLESDKKIWMFWRGEFWRYDGQKTEYMSNDIEPTLADLATARLTQVVGARFNAVNELWWSWPDANDTTSNTQLIRYNTDTNGWLNSAAQTIQWMVPTFVSGAEVFLTVGPTGRFLQQNSGTTFDSTAIVCVARPPWLASESWDNVKLWLETLVNFAREASGGGTVTLQYRVADHPNEMNAATFATIATFDNSLTTAHTESAGRSFIGDRAKWLQLQLTTTAVPLTIFWPWLVKARVLGQRSVY